jgi:hypothetical protein
MHARRFDWLAVLARGLLTEAPAGEIDEIRIDDERLVDDDRSDVIRLLRCLRNGPPVILYAAHEMAEAGAPRHRDLRDRGCGRRVPRDGRAGEARSRTRA